VGIILDKKTGNYYSTGPESDPVVCFATDGQRDDFPFAGGVLHVCYEPPKHGGPHRCACYHSNMQYTRMCTHEWGPK
jgi:hypothetical protein